MTTLNTDSLRLQVLQEVMELNDEELHQLHNTLTSTLSQSRTILYTLLHNSADELQEDKPTYTTNEVMNEIDKEMGWR